MTRTIKLPAEVAALLDAEAAQRGQQPAEYVRTLVEEQARLRSANGRRSKTPPSERVIVAGILDQLTGSERAFGLLLPTGERLRGTLPPGEPERFAALFGKKVVVDGIARFRKSGAVARLVASHLQLASEKDAIWERMPKPKPQTLADLEPGIPPPPGSNGMEFVFGKWPGDETTEELLAALKALD
jgi:hypothetical protein